MRLRERGQATPLLLYAAIVLVGTVALVVDAGVFFVTQHQVQNAADAAALAAVWSEDVCLFGSANGCEPMVPPTCSALHEADCVADSFAQANLGFAGALCQSVQYLPYEKRRVVPGNGLTYYLIQIDCYAPYWFARIFPSIPATMHISAHAMTTVGWRTPTGDASATPPTPLGTPPLVARLVL